MLWITHSLAAIFGGLVVYLGMTRTRLRNADRGDVKMALFAFAAALVMVGAGVQVALIQKSADDYRDRQETYAAQVSEQREADVRRQDCLNRFATDLAATLQIRVKANARLARAQDAKDSANDRVIQVVALGSRIPPEATAADFTAALEAAVRAKAHLVKVKAEVDKTLDRNEYPAPDTPRSVCGQSAPAIGESP